MQSMEIGSSSKYDYRDIKISYTPNIPQDDGATATMLSLLPEGTISKSTSRSLFSFVSNPTREKDLCEEEMKQEFDLMDDPYSDKANNANPNETNLEKAKPTGDIDE